MASRINTKFVIILVLGLIVVGGGAAALYYFAVYRDPNRYVSRGEALLAQGEYEEAAKQYGRAYGLEKNTDRKMQLLMQLADINLKVTEERSLDAINRLRGVLGYWSKVREFDPGHEQATQNLLNMLYTQAKGYSTGVAAWDNIYNICDDALKVVPDMALALKYRGIAQTMRMSQADRQAADRQQGLKDLQAASQAMPEDLDLPFYRALWHAVEADYQQRLSRDDQAKPLRDKALKICRDTIEKHPDQVEPRVNYISILLAVGRARQDESLIEQAQKVLDEAEERIDPKADAKFALQVANLLNALDRKVVELADGRNTRSGTHRAELLLRQVAKHHPDDLQVLVTLGNLLQQRGLIDDAMKFFEEAHKERSIVINADVYRFRAYQAQATYHLCDLALDKHQQATTDEDKKKWRDAAMQYKDILSERMPGHGLVDLVEGKLALTDGNTGLAVKKLDAANRQFGNRNAEALKLCAMALVRRGDTGAAVERLEQLIRTPEGRQQVKAYLDLSRLKMTHNDLPSAMQYVEIVIRNFPTMISALVLKSDILVRQAQQLPEGQTQQFQAKLREAAEVLDEAEDQDHRNIVFQRARIAGLAGKHQQAIAMLEKFCKDNPKDLLALQQYVRLLVSRDQKERALEILTQAQQAHPDQQMLDLMIQSLSGDREQSIAQIREILENVDDPLERELKLYAYYQQLGKEEQARKHLDQAIKADPRQEDERLLEVRFRIALVEKDWAAAQQIVDRVGTLNGGEGLDQASGKLWQGRLLLARGNARQAINVLDQAVKQMPIDSNGWALLGDARWQNEDLIGAQAAYKQALELKPNNDTVLRRMYQACMRLDQHEQALPYLKQLVRINPNDPAAYRMLLAHEGRFGDQQQALAKRLRLAEQNPKDQANRRAIAQLYLDLKQPAKARQVLDQLLAESPEDQINLLAMANYHYANNDFPTGRQLLLDYLHERGDAVDMDDWLGYARFLRQAMQVEEAKAAYRKAMQLEPAELRPASRELADWLFQRDEFGPAVELYREILAAAPEKEGKVWLRYIDALVNAEQYDEASKQINAYLDPTTKLDRDYQLTLLEARVAEQKNQSDEAQRLYDQAVALAPNNTTVYIQRARYRFSRDDLRPQVVDDLSKAIQLSPKMILPREMLVRWHQSRNDETSAIDELQRLVQVAPRYGPARMQLGTLLLNRRKFAELKSLLDESEREFPNVPAWSQLRARMSTLQSRPQDTVKHLADAYELNKTARNALPYIGALLSVNQTDKADALLREYPEQVAKSGDFQCLRARSLYQQGQIDPAKRSFALAVDLAKDQPNTLAFILRNVYAVLTIDEQEKFFRDKMESDSTGILPMALYQLWLSRGEKEKTEQALQGLRRLHQRMPDNVQVLRTLALACHQEELLPEAAGYYRAILEKVPTDLAVLNNLAYLYADAMDQADKAIPLAERAVAVAGKDPMQRANVLDTLGWVLYRAGQDAQAVSRFKESISLYPMKESHLHLAQVYLAQGLRTKAREELSQAKDYAEKDNDQAVLEQINRLMKQADASAAAGVER